MPVSLSLVGLAFSMEGPKWMLKHFRRYEADINVKYAKDKVEASNFILQGAM